MSETITFEATIAGLRAAGEETRLRILALLAGGELTVSDLTVVLGQSQPRISRHLKLLDDARLISRHREGAWVFCGLNRAGLGGQLPRLLAAIAADDPVIAADNARLADLRREQAEKAARYFATVAEDWDRIRALHVPEVKVEEALLAALPEGRLELAVDLGTGTGRIVSLIAPRAREAIGLDVSHDMLNVARTNLSRAGIRNVVLRQADIHAPNLETGAADLVVIHQVLHYLTEPERALRQAARLVRPGGTLLVVDFAPHEHEFLREMHAHQRLGFAREQIEAWMREAGLDPDHYTALAPEEEGGLTVSLWRAGKPQTQHGEQRLENVA